jgi:hypothetical protein
MNQALVDTIVDIMREAAQDALHPQALSPWESGAEHIIGEVKAAVAEEMSERFREAVQEALSISWRPLKLAPETPAGAYGNPAPQEALECSECLSTIYGWEVDDLDEGPLLCDECRPDGTLIVRPRRQRTQDAMAEAKVELPSWP